MKRKEARYHYNLFLHILKFIYRLWLIITFYTHLWLCPIIIRVELNIYEVRNLNMDFSLLHVYLATVKQSEKERQAQKEIVEESQYVHKMIIQ